MFSKNQRTPYNQITLSNNFMHTHRGLDWHPVALSDVYEAEIRRLRVENDTLKIHYNSVAVKLQALSQEKQQNAAKVQANQTLYNSQKNFWQLSKSARNYKKRKIRQLIIESTKGLQEFVPIEITFNVQGEELIIPLSKEDNEDEEPESTSDGAIQQVLVAKDAGLISDESYHELRMSLPEDQRVALPPVNAQSQIGTHSMIYGISTKMHLCYVIPAALVYHVPQFLEKYGSISIFNCQPVEKKNHEQSRMFHRGTQKGGRNSKYT